MKHIFRFLLVAILALGSKAAYADTLQFIFSDMPGYPFQFKVNGSNTITNLMCIDMNRRVTYNETWKVDITGMPLDNSATSIQYRADAYIYSLLSGTYSNGTLQYAAWSVNDMSDVSSTLTANKDTTTLASVNTLNKIAYQKAQDQTLINSGFFSAFQLYLPTADQTGWTVGVPQRYIGAATAAITPEPSSIVLMLTGALCIACAVMYRRFNTVEAANLA